MDKQNLENEEESLTEYISQAKDKNDYIIIDKQK